MSRDRADRLIVIGATAVPGNDELPQYLDPVCVDADEPDLCLIANVAPWDRSAPHFQPIPRERFEEECDAGYWQRLDTQVPFKWNHRLVALAPNRPPVYLPDEHAYAEVKERGEAAFEAVALDLAQKIYRDTPDERIWYAARALPLDPLPLLTLIALERDRLPSETLADLKADLPPPSGHRSPLMELAHQRGWKILLERVAHDPVGRVYLRSDAANARPLPDYLDGLPEVPNFLDRFHECIGNPYARAA